MQTEPSGRAGPGLGRARRGRGKAPRPLLPPLPRPRPHPPPPPPPIPGAAPRPAPLPWPPTPSHPRDLRGTPRRIIVFCADLSFDGADTSYKSLKAVLEGGIEGRPANVIFYATSTRRHLLSRDMIENERSTAINPGETVEEKVSLSDRFGLWLGFHPCSQDEDLAVGKGYCGPFGIKLDEAELEREALEWSTTRGPRPGR